MRDFVAIWPTLLSQDVPRMRSLSEGFSLELLAQDVEAMAARILVATLPGEREFAGDAALVDRFLSLASVAPSTEPRQFATIAAANIQCTMSRSEFANAAIVANAALDVVLS